jgi:hypothetical protein
MPPSTPYTSLHPFPTHATLFAQTFSPSTSPTPAPSPVQALHLLTNLYIAALQLAVPALAPACTTCSPANTPTPTNPPSAPATPAVSVDAPEWKAVFARTARLPFDWYADCDPLEPDPAVPTHMGSLADDIADIYRNVVTGLRSYDLGHHECAHWQWVTTFQSHWGLHAVDAIRALHHYLTAHNPSALHTQP